ncbi:MAG: 1-acyl-sn-glycerol-3-phosphate acyltransferase, partial [Halioglobus sp.]|nr:1-acyl-sn-glycerol-3-phosphate acyltransferase [Halioglobus sp.]
ADVVIAAKLLRRDIAGVGKQEIKKMPVIGQVMEFGGVVFIDRANAASAIDAMQPLVDAMRDDGKCVVLAPEGTRTVSPKLAPFKKGAFHLAMQAGVPIVPIVIHNALDVAPKGEFIFRSATVDVEVLPPVETDDWTVAALDEHVNDVRNMFLRALGQPEKKLAGKGKGGSRNKTKAKAKGKKKPAGKKKAGKAGSSGNKGAPSKPGKKSGGKGSRKAKTG